MHKACSSYPLIGTCSVRIELDPVNTARSAGGIAKTNMVSPRGNWPHRRAVRDGPDVHRRAAGAKVHRIRREPSASGTERPTAIPPGVCPSAGSLVSSNDQSRSAADPAHHGGAKRLRRFRIIIYGAFDDEEPDMTAHPARASGFGSSAVLVDAPKIMVFLRGKALDALERYCFSRENCLIVCMGRRIFPPHMINDWSRVY